MLVLRPFVVLMLICINGLIFPASGLAEGIAIRAEAVPLRPGDPEERRLGAFEYYGGLALSSSDSRFGGLSGLRLSADGDKLIAVSDHGYRIDLALRYDPDGRLDGVSAATIAPLRGPKGVELAELPAGNAEAVAHGDNCALIVAFEVRPRLLSYAADGSLPAPFPAAPGIDRAPRNSGIEALTRLRNGRLLALTEGWQVMAGANRGWIGGVAGWWEVLWRTSEGFQPTDAATLPVSGDVLVLERRILPPGARIRRLSARDIVPGAMLDGTEIARLESGVTFDNMEGIAVRRDARGQTLVYLLSDDNYAFFQRTLLMMFRLTE